MCSLQHKIHILLEKMTSSDKDLRFMATIDLITDLQKDSIKLDDETEKNVVRMVLKILEDKNGEVQNLAMKCLGLLVNKVKEHQVEAIVDLLCANLISNREHLRDISSIGLKKVISELPQTLDSLAPNICQRITGKLSNAIEKEDVSEKLEALDVLSDLLSRFGDFLLPFYSTILKALVPQLSSSRQTARRRSITALSHLLPLVNNNAYNGVIEHILDRLESKQNLEAVPTYIQCLASICRQGGHRQSDNHIDRAMALLQQYAHRDDDELREFCLQACEAFVMRCPEAICAHIPMILKLCMKYLTYDPNYNYEADGGNDNIMDTEEDEYTDSEEYSDDDDMSWKVRHAAVKCLETIIVTRHEMIEEFYRNLSIPLILCFKEREENVKSDIFHAFVALLKNTRHLDDITHNPNSMDQVPGSIALLMGQVPFIIKALQPLMREKSIKTRQNCLLLLSELLNTLPGSLGPYLDSVVPGIGYTLIYKNSTSNMKIDALNFLCSLLQGHQPHVFYAHISVLAPLIVNAVLDPFYKVSTEGLMVLQQLVKVMRPLDNCTAGVAPIMGLEVVMFATQVYSATLLKLKATDVDQEVKERAIASMGQIWANMGDLLQHELSTCLPIFLERLRSEETTLSSVKALVMIATSPLRIDLTPILNEMVPLLGTFLRKNQRALKLHSLDLLNKLAENYDMKVFGPALLKTVIAEIQPLLSDSDLHVAQFSLTLLATTARKYPQVLDGINAQFVSSVLQLLRSPQLQLSGSLENLNRMCSHQYQIANLLEKMTSNDKDFRFMATNDLMTELQKDSIKLDDESEKKVVRMVLKLLEDKNGEVQNLAVKCLGPLVNKVKEHQVETIVDSLCANMISNTEQLRDISSIGLKTVISELPQTSNSLAPNVCQRITGKLSNAIEKEDVSVKLEALDILSDLLSRFGDFLLPFHSTILKALVPQLSSSRQAVRKRSIVALSHLLTLANNNAYNGVIDHLLDGLENPQNQGAVRTYIQCLASICRQAGHRLCNHIDRAMVLLQQYSHRDDDELREFCLQACEAFVMRCPEAICAHIPMILKLCMKYLTYDPNYNYEADDGDDNIVMDTEEDEYIDSEEYSDDDDMSWKVRRAAAKCLESIIATRHEMIEEFYRNLSLPLISRFKEREENVKSDIFHAFVALLKNTRHLDDITHNPDSMDQVPGSIALLMEQVPYIIKAVQPLMREKSMKTRQDCFLLLRELLIALPGSLGPYLDSVVPGIGYSLNDKNSTSNMKIDALSFLCSLLQGHQPHVFYAHIPVLVPLIVNAVFDPFYKISTEGLMVLQQLVKVMRPLDNCTAGVAPVMGLDVTPFATEVYSATLLKLKATDVDQEVKERAIASMGQIWANMGDLLQHELSTCLPIFLERLRSEVTRLSSVKALTMIAASPLRIDLTPILEEVVPLLGTFLRKNQRALKLHSLDLLNKLADNYAMEAFGPPLLKTAIAEIQPLISDSDLHVAQFSLTLLTTTARKHPQALVGIHDQFVPSVLQLLRSPLLQGSALTCTHELFKALVQTKLPGLDYHSLLKKLVEPVSAVAMVGPGVTTAVQDQLHKQAYHSLAKCVAALTQQCPQEAIPLAQQLLRDLQKEPSIGDTQLVFCLLAIGEIGRHFDLSSIPLVSETIINCFGAGSEDIKVAASHALGAVAVGSLTTSLPLILIQIEAQPKRQYLLLHSLKELISSLSLTPTGLSQLLPSVPSIWTQLFKHCECPEEGSRNVVAECLGKLVLVSPEKLLPRLEEALHSESPLMRTAVVSAIKFTISDQPQPIDGLLKQSIGQFLFALRDPEPSVRRVALVAFNSAVHNKPTLVRDLLPTLLPWLYLETKVKSELIREVEMGPFKHTVDDGLDIRKAAFECMYTLLEQGLDRVDVMQFLDHVQAGLSDHYDIKMLTYLMTARLAVLCPDAVLLRLDQFVQQLRDTCTHKVKANSVKQEYEKQDELKRSALRAVCALSKIPKADKNQQLTDFLKSIKDSPELSKIHEYVQKDTVVNNTEFVMDQS